MEIWTAGRGDVVGEIALLDDKGHTMSVLANEAATVLALDSPTEDRVDFIFAIPALSHGIIAEATGTFADRYPTAVALQGQ